jgi:hypothetical protein
MSSINCGIYPLEDFISPEGQIVLNFQAQTEENYVEINAIGALIGADLVTSQTLLSQSSNNLLTVNALLPIYQSFAGGTNDANYLGFIVYGNGVLNLPLPNTEYLILLTDATTQTGLYCVNVNGYASDSLNNPSNITRMSIRLCKSGGFSLPDKFNYSQSYTQKNPIQPASNIDVAINFFAPTNITIAGVGTDTDQYNYVAVKYEVANPAVSNNITFNFSAILNKIGLPR